MVGLVFLCSPLGGRLASASPGTDWVLSDGFVRPGLNGMVRIADMQSVLGRLSLPSRFYRCYGRSWGLSTLGTSAVSQCHTLSLPKAIDLILVFLEALMLKGIRVARVAKHSVETAPELFRTDARAEGAEMHIGGWACADSDDPRLCRCLRNASSRRTLPSSLWRGSHIVRYLHLSCWPPWLRCFSSLRRLRALRGQSVRRERTIKGLAHSVEVAHHFGFRWWRVLMELTAVLLEKSCMLELTWAPRLQNVLADS